MKTQKAKQYVMIGILILCMAILTIGIVVGETDSAEMMVKQRTESYLNRLQQATGIRSLGVVDAYAVSQKTGDLYNGPAVDRALFAQNGLEYEANSWDFFLNETEDGVMIFKKVVYTGEQKEPIWQQDVKAVYLYGMF